MKQCYKIFLSDVLIISIPYILILFTKMFLSSPSVLNHFSLSYTNYPYFPIPPFSFSLSCLGRKD